MINRENYEAYFLDYHEGRLSPDGVAQLLLFLEKNPELKELFYEYEEVELDKEHVVFEEKDTLKKEVLDITTENYQEYLVAWLEGELTKGQAEVFENYLLQHPELSEEVKLFRKTFLAPDSSVVLDNKESLKKSLVDVTAANCEEYFIASAEGLLNPEEEKRVQVFIRRYPVYAKEYNVYRQLKLAPDTSIVFAEKNKLKQIPYNKKSAIRPLYYYVAAAASVILLLGIFFNIKDTPDAPGLAEINAPEKQVPLYQQKEKQIVSPEEDQNAPAVLMAENTSPAKHSGAPVQESVGEGRLPVLMYISPASLLASAASDPLQDKVVSMLPDEYYVIFPLDVVVTENEPPIADTEKAGGQYLTVKQSIVKNIKSKLYKDNPENNRDESKFTLWDAAYAGAKGLNKISGRDGDVKLAKNEKGGNVLTAGNFEISQH